MKNTTNRRGQHVFLIVGGVLGWFTLLLQFYLLIGKGVAPVPEVILRFFGYFTILTNILVATYCTIRLLIPQSALGRFFSSDKVLTAITIYISMVGILYQLLLRHVWDPQGLDRVADELLHTIIPAFFIFFWMLFAQKSGLKWKDVLPWQIYTVCYFIYTLWRGAYAQWYPYPFIDVIKLGYKSVAINGVLLLIGSVLFSLIFVAIAKTISKTRLHYKKLTL